MKKTLFIIFVSLFMSVNGYAETLLLKCEFIDGKLDRYKDNKFLKVEKINDPTKEHEIKLNTALKKIILDPYSALGLEMEVWKDDYVLWILDMNMTGPFDVQYIYNLDRVTGILTYDHKSYKRVVEDGKYLKKSNGDWVRDTQFHITSTYQCEKKDRLF
jgi:hypothetical protein